MIGRSHLRGFGLLGLSGLLDVVVRLTARTKFGVVASGRRVLEARCL